LHIATLDRFDAGVHASYLRTGSVDFENAAQKHDIQSTFSQEQDRDALLERLLDAWAFPEMNQRQNMIEGRIADFGETYHWIFDPPPSYGGYQHDFVEWLRSGKEIFWISPVRKEFPDGVHLPKSPTTPYRFRSSGRMGTTESCPAAQLLVFQTSYNRVTKIARRFLEVTVFPDNKHGREAHRENPA
jgi:hypothetical protein